MKNSFCKIYIIFLLLILFQNNSGYAQTSLKGYLDSRFFLVNTETGFSSADPDAEKSYGGYSRARFKLSSKPGENSFLYIAADLFHYYGYMESLINLSRISSAAGGMGTSTNEINLDRAYFQLYHKNLELTIGRQRIAWGQSFVWSPFDVFNRKNVFEPQEEKGGVDGVRSIIRLGQFNALEAVFTPGETFKISRMGVRLRFQFSNIDGVINVIKDYDGFTTRQLYGATFRGENEIGWWFEIARARDKNDILIKQTFPFKFADFFYRKWYNMFVFGADYTFMIGNGVTITAEFLYDESGEPDMKKYDFRLSSNGRRTFLAQKYVYTSMQYDFTDLWSGTIANVSNLDDSGLILIPNLRYAYNQNVDFIFGGNLFFADSGTEFNPAGLDDPFGIIGNNQFYTWMKIYF